MKKLKDEKSNLLIFGQESTSKEIRECVFDFYPDFYSEVITVIGNNDYPNFKSIYDQDLENYIIQHPKIKYIVGFSNLYLRIKMQSKLNEFGIEAVNVIHPTAVIASSAKIGIGNYVGAHVVISSNATIGNNNIINIGTSIGHDSVIGTNCIINPGVRISGNCIIKNGTLIGANTVVFQGKTVGCECLIDAMTYIDTDIPDFKLCTSKSQLKIYKNIISPKQNGN